VRFQKGHLKSWPLRLALFVAGLATWQHRDFERESPDTLVDGLMSRCLSSLDRTTRLFPLPFLSTIKNDNVDWFQYPHSARRQVDSTRAALKCDMAQHPVPNVALLRCSTRWLLIREHSRTLKLSCLLRSIYLRSH
jgi:hypothetical protein